MTWLDFIDLDTFNRASPADLIFMVWWVMSAIGFAYLARDLEHQGAPQTLNLFFGLDLTSYRIIIALAAVSWPMWTPLLLAYTIARAFMSHRNTRR